MTTRVAQHRTLAVLVALAAAVTTVAPAGATASTARGEAQAVSERVRSEGFGPAAPVQDAATGGEYGAAAVTPATCPAGTVRARSVLTDGFEDGLPDDGAFTEGWVRQSQGAPVGSWFAAAAAPTTPGGFAGMLMEEAYVTPGSRTQMSFLVKGKDGAGAPGQSNVGFWVNEEGWSLVDLEPDEWFRITVDVTAATREHASGYLDIGFGHIQDPATPGTHLAVDDVQVYTCGAPPASGVRGDWTGEGLADVLGVTGDGVLHLYPGKGDGAVGSGVEVGHGWSAMTWLGSPGDVTGDRRTDLVARRADGTLFLYAGRGGGGFGSAVQVGTSWNGMTALTAGGDFDGDGRPDLLARRSDGALFRYTFTSATRLSPALQIGSGWNSMSWLVGTDDLDGDRVADVLAVHSSGDLYLYRGSAAGLRTVGKVGSGWSSMTWVTSPGDLNRDGRGDVVGRTAAGALYFYAGAANGVRPGRQVGSGWTGIDTIL